MKDVLQTIKELPEICHRCRSLKPDMPDDKRREIIEEVKRDCPRHKWGIMKCLLLDVEMPIGEKCPSVFNDNDLICYKECGLADNPELIQEKVNN